MSALDEAPASVFGADPIHSSFGFAVRYLGGSTYRATFSDAQAVLDLSDGQPVLTGAAAAKSISIDQPEPFRAHVLGPEFFDAETHPQLHFSSTRVDLRPDGTASVEGELSIKGTTRRVTAHGTWAEPAPDPMRHVRSHLALETTINRRDFGITWDAPLPDGTSALGDEVTITIDLALAAKP